MPPKKGVHVFDFAPELHEIAMHALDSGVRRGPDPETIDVKMFAVSISA